MINHVTRGIKISVKVFFDGSYFKNYILNYSFSYTISISNQSKNSVQLKSRHWRIFDSLNCSTTFQTTLDFALIVFFLYFPYQREK